MDTADFGPSDLFASPNGSYYATQLRSLSLAFDSFQSLYELEGVLFLAGMGRKI